MLDIFSQMTIAVTQMLSLVSEERVQEEEKGEVEEAVEDGKYEKHFWRTKNWKVFYYKLFDIVLLLIDIHIFIGVDLKEVEITPCKGKK